MDKKSKKIIIYNNFYHFDKKIDSCFIKDNGEALNIDRSSTILDDILMFHANVKNKFITFLMNYFFYNSDFRKQKSLSSKKANGFRIFNTTLFLLSIIGLIICLVFGVAVPVFNSSVDSIQLFRGEYVGSVIANNKVIGWVIDQNNLISFINSLTADIQNITKYSELENNKNLAWFANFISNYWSVQHGFGSNYDGALLHFKDFLQTHVFANFHFVNFNDDFQVLVYFSLVNQTINLSDKTIDYLNNFFQSFNGLYFTELSSNNIFYGLNIKNICLAGNKSSQALLVPKIWQSWFSYPNVIAPLCFTILFLLIILLNYYIFWKSKPKYNTMTIYDFVGQKVNFLRKFKFLLGRMVFLDPNINQLKHNVIFNVDKLDKPSFYNLIRLLNYTFSILESVSIILVCDYNLETIKNLDMVFKDDTKNLSYKIIDDDCIKHWTNNQKLCTKSDIEKQNLNQYYNYLLCYVNAINNEKDYDILKVLFRSLKQKFINTKISIEQQEQIISKVIKETNSIDICEKDKIFTNIKIGLKMRNKQFQVLFDKLTKKSKQNHEIK